MTRTIAHSLACAWLLIAATPVLGQEPASPPATAGKTAATPATPSATTGTNTPAPLPAQPYTYDPQGRRDPFVSLLSRGSDPGSATARPPGLPGMLVSEVTVKGIVRDRTGFIAMVQGTSKQTHIVRSGEKLMDGTVKAITADTVVFSEDVHDPLSMVKQKEVRKSVRPADGGRQQ